MDSSNEKSKTVAKLIFFISVILLISLIVILINPFNLFSASSKEKPNTTDLEQARDNIIEKFNDYNGKIKTSTDNAKALNVSINELKTYTNELPKYAIGGGISFIIGLWISTYILYRKERNELFEE